MPVPPARAPRPAPPAPLPPASHLARRLLGRAVAFAGFVGVALGAGAAGVRWTEGRGWLDATLDAAMLLTGMGPTFTPTTAGGKRFAIGYALFSGIAFLSLVGFLLAPVFHRFLHRFLHRFHLDLYGDADG